ncbi:MAG: Gfo/Idh/MocA family oxidoreductase [Pseudomonadales bacterium]
MSGGSTSGGGLGDGANYAPAGQARPVVKPGEFQFAAAFLDHGHIYGQCQGLVDAGATLTHVYDPDAERVAKFCAVFDGVQPVDSFEALLESPQLHLIASAAIPDQRAQIGQQVMQAGKDYFTDKCPFTTLEQLAATRQVVEQTRRRYLVYYAERVHNEAAWHAGELIAQGEVGVVIQVLNIAPHRLAKATRPSWFFNKLQYGGILTDIGSHQVEQFLTYAGCADGVVEYARVRNVANADTPELEDFGEFAIRGDNEASFYSRVDWFTPTGSPVWGDGRTFILGTRGSLELRKYTDPGRQTPASLVLAMGEREGETIDCLGRVGFPFFGQMILDCLNGTEHAMTQAHIFKAAELSLEAQALADQQR